MKKLKRNFCLLKFCRNAIKAFRRIIHYRSKSYKPVPANRQVQIKKVASNLMTCTVSPANVQPSIPKENDKLISLANSGINVATRIEAKFPTNPSISKVDYLVYARRNDHKGCLEKCISTIDHQIKGEKHVRQTDFHQ